MHTNHKDYIFLRCCVLLSVLVFLCYLLIDLGALSLIIDSDRSKISLIILLLYIGSSLHWFYLAWTLGNESDAVSELSAGRIIKDNNKINHYLKFCEGKTFIQKQEMLSVLSDEMSNRHSFGYMSVDFLLKLGLTGTVVGFILMLIPIGEIKEFDPQVLQQLLATMSGGMAVALYTTLTGLLTSMLLKFQYFLLDTTVTNVINYLSGRLHEES